MAEVGMTIDELAAVVAAFSKDPMEKQVFVVQWNADGTEVLEAYEVHGARDNDGNLQLDIRVSKE